MALWCRVGECKILFQKTHIFCYIGNAISVNVCDVGCNCAASFSFCTICDWDSGRAEACEQQHSGRVGYFNNSAAAYLGQSQSGAEECPALEAWRAKQLAPLRIPFLLPPHRRVVPHREWALVLLLSVSKAENYVWHVSTEYWLWLVAQLRSL